MAAPAVSDKYEIVAPEDKYEIVAPKPELEIPDANAQARAAVRRPIEDATSRDTDITAGFKAAHGGQETRGSISSRLHDISGDLEAKRDAAELQNARQGGAKFNDPAMAYDAGSRLAKVGAGLTSPTSVGIGAGMLAMPEIVGPALVAHGLYTAGKHAKGAIHGNPEEVGEALGGLAEAAGGGAGAGEGVKSWKGSEPSLIGRGVDAVKRAVGKGRLTPAEASEAPATAEFQPAFRNTPAEVLHHAAKEGIELTTGQGTGAPVAKMMQALGERSLVGSKQLAEGIDKNAGKFIQSVKGFADRVDPKASGLSEAGAGEAIKQSAETAKSVSHDNASAGFKNLAFADKAPVDPKPISDKWVSMREELPMGAEEQILAQVPRNMRATVDEMLSPTGMKTPLPFKQAIALRSLFRELGESETLPTRVQGAFRQMSKSTDSAMESTAKAGGFEINWRDANAGWKAHVEKFGDKQSPLVRILKQADPTKITRDILNRGSAHDIEILQNEKMDAALEPIKRQVVQEIARSKFSVGKDGLGGYSHEFLNTLFGKAGVDELYLKANIGRRFNWQMNPSGTSNVMVGEHQVTHPEPSKLMLMAGTAKAARPRPSADMLPEFGFRTRDVGDPSINLKSHAHATATLEDAQRLAPGRARTTGKPQEVQRVRLSKMNPQDYDYLHRPNEAPWIKFNRQLGPGDYEALPAPRSGSERLAPIGTAAAGREIERVRPKKAGKR